MIAMLKGPATIADTPCSTCIKLGILVCQFFRAITGRSRVCLFCEITGRKRSQGKVSDAQLISEAAKEFAGAAKRRQGGIITQPHLSCFRLEVVDSVVGGEYAQPYYVHMQSG